MTRTKLVFIGFVAARNCVPQQVLDDAKSLHTCGRSHSATTCDSSHAPKSAKYYSIATKVLLQYCSVLQSITKYYPLRCSTKYYFVLQYTPYYEVLLQYYAVLQVLLQQFSVLQSSTSVLLCSTIVLFSTVLLCNTKYRRLLPQFYSVLQSTTTYYETTIQYYSVLRTTKRPSSTTPYYKVLQKLPKPQLFKQQASKTSILCEASSTFQQQLSFQNEHFVRGIFNFSSKKLPKSCACHAKCENDLSP